MTLEFVQYANNNFDIFSLKDNININNKLNIISIDGKLDVSTSEKVKQEILAKMATHKSIIIDMSHCDYISNYGIYFLSTIADQAKLLHVKVVFISILDKISEIFTLTGLTDTIDSAPSIEDAIREYALN